MYSVEDLFRNLGSGTANDFMVFRKWLSNKICSPSEAGKLEWVLTSSEISDRTKLLLTEAIAEANTTIEDEKTTLLKVGHTTGTHRDYVEKTRKRIEEQCQKMRTAFFAMAGGFGLVFLIVCANYHGGTKDYPTFLTLAMLFFGLTVVCLTQAWNASTDIKNAQETALKLENEAVGRDLQIRMTVIENEEEQLSQLNKTVVKTNTSVA